jgi:O-antigen/teichoic acid export membrane protein
MDSAGTSPTLLAQGTATKPGTSEATAWSICLGLSLIGLLPTTVLALATGTSTPVLVVWMLGSWSLLQVQQVILRSHLKFTAASSQQLALGVLASSASAIFVVARMQTLEQAILLHTVANLGALSTGLLGHAPLMARPSWKTAIRLAEVGLPIAAAGGLFGLLVSLDRWIAASMFGTQAAAPYALASTVAMGLMVLPNALSQQTYPRMALAYGATGDAGEVLRLARLQNRAAGRVTVLAVGLGSVAASVVILLLPRVYLPAIPVLIPLNVSLLALAYSTGYGNALNTLGRQWLYLGVQAGALVTAAGVMVALGQQLGLIGIALGVGSGYLTFAALTRWAVRRVMLAVGSDGCAVTSRAPSSDPISGDHDVRR